MASQSTIYSEIKKAVASRKSEGAQLTAVQTVLVRHGGKLKKPDVAHTRAGATGISLRIYSFIGTKAGDFALITGPGVVGETKTFKELDTQTAPKGFYVEAGAGGSTASKRVSAAMKRAEAAAKRAAGRGSKASAPRKPRKTASKPKPREGMSYRAPAPKASTRRRSHSGRTGIIPGASYKPVRTPKAATSDDVHMARLTAALRSVLADL
jgi:hypothetical protein